MKKSCFIVALAVTVAAGSVALAGEKAKSEKPAAAPAVEKAKATPTKPEASAKETKTELTGSYIKRDIKRNGQITDGMNPVLVIDSKSVQNSGASDLRQLLIRQGVNR